MPWPWAAGHLTSIPRTASTAKSRPAISSTARASIQIPYRCYYSRNLDNLFLAGRIISATHVAFGSTRVQGTLGHAAQAVAVAAAQCVAESCSPRDLLAPPQMAALQRRLLRLGQFIPGVPLDDPSDPVRTARLRSSSALALHELPDDGPLQPLNYSRAQMLPLPAGPVPRLTLVVDAEEDTELFVELRTSDRPDNYTPDVVLDSRVISLSAGANQELILDFATSIDEPRYVFVCLLENTAVSVHTSEQRLTGVLSVANAQNPAVSNYGKQEPQEDIGIERFEFWIPQRRPSGQNFALKLDPPLALFGPDKVRNGYTRPTSGPNAWVAALDDPRPTLELVWDEPQTVSRLDLFFDNDFDHPMESVLHGHPERVMPFCVRHYRVLNCGRELLAEVSDNHQTINTLHFDPPLQTDHLVIECLATHGGAPAALFAVHASS